MALRWWSGHPSSTACTHDPLSPLKRIPEPMIRRGEPSETQRNSSRPVLGMCSPLTPSVEGIFFRSSWNPECTDLILESPAIQMLKDAAEGVVCGCPSRTCRKETSVRAGKSQPCVSCCILRMRRKKSYICDQKEETWNVLVFIIKAGKTAWIQRWFQLANDP